MLIADHESMRARDRLTKDDFARMDEEARRGGGRWLFSEEYERMITEPHTREKNGDPPIWLLWEYDVDGDYVGIPQLIAICTNEWSIRYHLGAELDGQKPQPLTRTDTPEVKRRLIVERSIVDHRYGSTMMDAARSSAIFTRPIVVGNQPTHYSPHRSKWPYRREGD